MSEQAELLANIEEYLDGEYSRLHSPPPLTLAQASRNFDIAVGDFLLEVAYGLCMPQILGWLTKKIEGAS